MRTHDAGALHADVSEPQAGLLAPPADLTALAPAVWPVTAARGPDGALAVGGVDVRDLATTHGTPAYVLDEHDLRTRCREFLAAFGVATDPTGGSASGADVHYAAKAFCCLA